MTRPEGAAGAVPRWSRPRTRQRRALLTPALALAAAAAALAAAAPAEAQVIDTAVTTVDSIIIDPQVPVAAGRDDTAPRLPLTPRGAFIRSMILPGWGQAAFGAYFRGGIYFSGWAGNAFGLFKTIGKLDDARARFDLRESQIADSIIAASENPDSMRVVLETTPLLESAVREDSLGDDLRKLVRAREQQREDWIAWSLFWLLASGVDAYVTAHLADFPAAIAVEPNADRSVTVRLEVPLPGRRW